MTTVELDDDEEPPESTEVAERMSGRLDGRTWKYVLSRTVRGFSRHQGTDSAAGLTYYAVLALFPALIAVFSLLGLAGQSRATADAVIGIIRDVAPGDTATILSGPIQQVAHAPGAGFALVLGIVLAVWSASGYVGAFSRAMNRTYEIDEGRPFWRLRPMQLLVTVIVVLATAVMAVLLVLSGSVVQAIGRALGVGGAAVTVWSVLKWPVLLIVVVVLVAVLYHFTPNLRRPRFRWFSVGAIVAIIALAAGTLVFGLYVSGFSHYGNAYGAFAGVIIFLLWLWIANIALLFGAELDAEIERGRELQAGVAAEKSVQLPPIDTRKSDKQAARRERDLEEGRGIRDGR